MPGDVVVANTNGSYSYWYHGFQATAISCLICCVKILQAANYKPTSENKTRCTCGRHNGTVITGREWHSEETNWFQYGGHFCAAAVNLALHPITIARVVSFVVAVAGHEWDITNSYLFHYCRWQSNIQKPAIISNAHAWKLTSRKNQRSQRFHMCSQYFKASKITKLQCSWCR